MREIEYWDGEVLAVEYLSTSDRRLPRHMFVCPTGTEVVELAPNAGLETSTCKTTAGEEVGPRVSWQGDCVQWVQSTDGSGTGGGCPQPNP